MHTPNIKIKISNPILINYYDAQQPDKRSCHKIQLRELVLVSKAYSYINKIEVASENKAYLQNHHTTNKIDALKLLSVRKVTYTNTIFLLK